MKKFRNCLSTHYHISLFNSAENLRKTLRNYFFRLVFPQHPHLCVFVIGYFSGLSQFLQYIIQTIAFLRCIQSFGKQVHEQFHYFFFRQKTVIFQGRSNHGITLVLIKTASKSYSKVSLKSTVLKFAII